MRRRRRRARCALRAVPRSRSAVAVQRFPVALYRGARSQASSRVLSAGARSQPRQSRLLLQPISIAAQATHLVIGNAPGAAPSTLRSPLPSPPPPPGTRDVGPERRGAPAAAAVQLDHRGGGLRAALCAPLHALDAAGAAAVCRRAPAATRHDRGACLWPRCGTLLAWWVPTFCTNILVGSILKAQLPPAPHRARPHHHHLSAQARSCRCWQPPSRSTASWGSTSPTAWWRWRGRWWSGKGWRAAWKCGAWGRAALGLGLGSGLPSWEAPALQRLLAAGPALATRPRRSRPLPRLPPPRLPPAGRVADASRMPPDLQQLAGVVSVFGLQQMPAPADVLAAWAQALQPGAWRGRLRWHAGGASQQALRSSREAAGAHSGRRVSPTLLTRMPLLRTQAARCASASGRSRWRRAGRGSC